MAAVLEQRAVTPMVILEEAAVFKIKIQGITLPRKKLEHCAMKVNKKSQITLFLVIGIIVLVLFVIVYSIRSNEQQAEQKKAQETQASPVYDFVQACMIKITKEAVDLMKSRGGFIDTSTLKINPLEPTESEGLEMIQGSKFVVPYWHYMKSPNECLQGCEFSSWQRPLCKKNCPYAGQGSFEEVLESYVNQYLARCIGGFYSFKVQGIEVEEKAMPNASIRILEEKIYIVLDYPLEIKENDKLQRIDRFEVEFPSMLYQLYVTANTLTAYAREKCYLEDAWLNYLSYYSGVDKNRLPPFSAISKEKVTWLLTDIEPKMRGLTQKTIELIRLYNTSQIPFYTTGNEKRDNILNQFIYFPFPTYTEVFVVQTYYPWHKPYFTIYPNKNNLMIEPEKKGAELPTFLASLIGTKPDYEYKARYMYSFPVVVTLRMFNHNTFSEETFTFALEANIRNNQCFKVGSSYGFRPSQDSLLCYLDFRTNKTYEIKVYDDYRQTPINNATVAFYAGDTCVLGTTNTQGILKTTLPIAESGLLKVEKEGYLPAYKLVEEYASPRHVLKLQPLFKKKVVFKLINESVLIPYQHPDAQPPSIQEIKAGAVPITPRFYLAGMIERINTELEEAHQQYLLYSNTSATETILLTKGKYSITAQLIDNTGLYLPAEYNRVCEAKVGASCAKTPVDLTCWPRGESEDDFKRGTCYLQGYKCMTSCERDSNFNLAIQALVSEGKQAFIQKMSNVNPLFPPYVFEWEYDSYIEDYIANPFLDYCWPIKGCAADEEIKYDAISMEAFPRGGIYINKTHHTPWVISSYEQLDNEKSVIIYLYLPVKPARIHQLGTQMQKHIEVSSTNPRLVMPEIK
ncbi:MAG: hypothetical protein QW594_01990 [Candidatus Woesearchaeota archaeon]